MIAYHRHSPRPTRVSTLEWDEASAGGLERGEGLAAAGELELLGRRRPDLGCERTDADPDPVSDRDDRCHLSGDEVQRRAVDLHAADRDVPRVDDDEIGRASG